MNHTVCPFKLIINLLKAIRQSITSAAFATIEHAFICSRRDYCNSLLVGLSSRAYPLQSVFARYRAFDMPVPSLGTTSHPLDRLKSSLISPSHPSVMLFLSLDASRLHLVLASS